MEADNVPDPFFTSHSADAIMLLTITNLCCPYTHYVNKLSDTWIISIGYAMLLAYSQSYETGKIEK